MGRPKGHVLDKTDIRLLQELQKNPELTLQELAGNINIKYSPCRRRLQWLLDNKYIRKAFLVNEQKSTWNDVRYLFVDVQPDDAKTIEFFERQVTTIKNVTSCHEVSGRWDFLLRIETKGREEFENIRRQIASIVPGSKTETYSVNRSAKIYQVPVDSLL
jgi:Lrp/AsnC family transcriptional regulator, leucine-responsive regulatory protein